jgi:hypothetical protein
MKHTTSGPLAGLFAECDQTTREGRKDRWA